MHLKFEGKTTEAPTAADIARAVPRGRIPEEWTIELVGDDGVSIEADPGPEESHFHVAYVEGRRIYDASTPIAADQLERLMVSFLRRDPDWRKQVDWTIWAPEPRASTRASGWLPAALILLVLLTALGVVLWYHEMH